MTVQIMYLMECILVAYLQAHALNRSGQSFLNKGNFSLFFSQYFDKLEILIKLLVDWNRK